MPKYDFEDFIEYNRTFRTTVIMTVPPIWIQIAKSPKVSYIQDMLTTYSQSNRDQVTTHFDSIEVACTGAAPMVSIGAQLRSLRPALM